MAIFELQNIEIKGLVASIPSQVVSNLEYTILSEKERQLFVKTTGINERRIVRNGQCASDLCFEAAQKLLQKLDWEPQSIELLVFVTQTPDYITPATAITLQQRLGLPPQCLAFDINLGCSAYVYGLSVVGSLLSAGKIQRGLLLVGDAASRIVSEKDKSVAPIFSDAGSATALQYSQNAAPMYFNLQSDGAGYEAIIVPHGGARNPVTEESLEYTEHEKGITRNLTQMALNGLDIFNFTLREVTPNIEALLAHLQKDILTFDYCVFHQANLLLNERIRQKLKLPTEKVPYSIQKFGNTSCTTLPLTMASELRTELQTKPLELLLSGFGVGLSWGSVVLSTQPLGCCELIEVA